MIKLYLILNYTWGILMTLIGYGACAVLRCAGFRPKRIGPCYHFMVGSAWGGLTLGMTIITDDEPNEWILDHEFGHSVQNAFFGPLFPFLIAIPSVIRYWKRKKDEKNGKELPDYDSVWFEGQATELGTTFRSLFDEPKK